MAKWTKKTPRMDMEVIKADIATQSREPFREVLTKIMGAQPDEKYLKAFADGHPDRWGHLVVSMAKLSGYSDGHEGGTINVYQQINTLSDSALTHKLAEALDSIKQFGLSVSEKEKAPIEGAVIDEKDGA